ncbi:hypothetical protein ACOSP7_022094 [Xanthoceras sorbifolium]
MLIVMNNAVMKLMRGARSQLSKLLAGLAIQDLQPMELMKCRWTWSRYALQFFFYRVLGVGDNFFFYFLLFFNC